jgi:hypothetical protein
MRLWRYMDFTKFVSLISSSKLFFCRADRFKDPFEGSYPKANLLMRPEVYEGTIAEAMLPQLSAHYSYLREWTFISCWHANEFESAAMWDLYGKTNQAVAIETSYAKLQHVLPEEAFLGFVKYIDYETEWLPEGNSFYSFMHKRKSFEHEKEVRAVMHEYSRADLVTHAPNPEHGMSVPIMINELISNVHVAPTAPKWLADLVAEVAAKYGLSATVKKSDLFSEPVF